MPFAPRHRVWGLRRVRATKTALWLLYLALGTACPRDKGEQAPRTTDDDSVRGTTNRCLGPRPRALGALRPLTIAGARLAPRGTLLAPTGSRHAVAGPLRLGVLADTREPLPRTLAAVRRLSERFAEARVDAVVVLGGLAESYEGILQVLRQLGRGPILALPGDSESRSGFGAAIENLTVPAVDLTIAPLIQLRGPSLLAVPGYHLAEHLRAGPQGCSYSREDLRWLARTARALRQPRILLAHGPPRSKGEGAIDRALGGVNIGDPALRRLVEHLSLRFGLFAHVREAGLRAITVDGRPVPPGKWSDSLLLNVGAADAVPHEHLRGGWEGSSAAIFEIDGARARFTPVRLPARQ